MPETGAPGEPLRSAGGVFAKNEDAALVELRRNPKGLFSGKVTSHGDFCLCRLLPVFLPS
jgi:hypothetical protein